MNSSFFILPILFCLVVPPIVHAGDSTTYATAVTYTSANLLSSSYALGAPDNFFADFRADNASITLDLGVETTSDLTLTYRVFDSGAAARVDFLDAASAKLQTSSNVFSIADDTLTINYSGTTAYRYVTITAVDEETWSVDAVSIKTTIDESTTDNTTEPPTPEQTTGMLVKLENSNTVYELGSDGKRHAFPNQVIFESWYDSSSSDITTIDATTMASYELGDNVTMRPGTWLVKITTDPKVYAVEPGGVLRWVTSEVIAVALYGANWNTKVADVADVFWHNYSFGDDVTSAVYPDGTFLVKDGGSGLYEIPDAGYWYVENGVRYSISDSMRMAAELYIPTLFTHDAEDETLSLYVDGGDLDLTNDIQYPF